MGLDHGQSFEQAVRCIESGFSGVMIDLSSEDYDRNVYETKRVVEYAHARGISVEAEIGKIFDATCPVEVIATGYTDPDVARRVAKAIYRKAELGQVSLQEFPMLVHANDVLDNGKDAELPWEKFTFDHTAN